MADCYYNGFNDYVCDSNSSWYNWGRWVALGVIVAVALLATLAYVGFAYMSTRRRARSGQKPMWGTGWAAPPPYSQTDPNTKDAGMPAPPYTPETYDLGQDSSRGRDAAHTEGQYPGVQIPEPGHAPRTITASPDGEESTISAFSRPQPIYSSDPDRV